ncbi:MAG: hypothetical protein AB8E15_11415 [Bdellovibrionales bacterium]
MKLFKKIYAKLPKKMRGNITRRLYDCDLSGSEDYIFKLAETFEEKKTAFRLIQENYLQSGLSKTEDQLRVSKYNFLPSTHIFIAKEKSTGDIVASMSIIVNSAAGLPVSKRVNVKKIAGDDNQSVEISSLFVDKKHRSKSRGISSILMFYSVWYSYTRLGMVHAFISVRNSVRYFYEDLFFFEPITKPTRFEEVNGSLGISLYMHFPNALLKMKKHYRNRPLRKNVYLQLVDFPWKNQCDFKETDERLISRSFFDLREVSFLKKMANSVSCEMSVYDKMVINSKNQNSIFPNIDSMRFTNKTRRYELFKQAKLFTGERPKIVNIIDISKEGIGLYFKDSNLEEDILKVRIANNGSYFDIRLRKCWQEGSKFGFKVLDKENLEWMEYYNKIESLVIPNSEGISDLVA